MRSGNSQCAVQGGFTYIALLITIAVMMVGATAALEAGAALQQREAEAELLSIGMEFRQALGSYAEATPVGQPDAPRELKELLRAPRYPGVRRHLRRTYPDPLTGGEEWGIVRSPEGRIIGLHSLSRSPTIRHTGFPAGIEGLEQAKRHDEWIFGLTPNSHTSERTIAPAKH